jgi:LPXTG-motif cell wall-anchored protein
VNLSLIARRAGAAVVAAAALALGGAAPAGAVTTTDPAAAGAGWLARQLTGAQKDHFVFPGGSFADVGLTIDAVLAFDGAGVAGTAAGRATAFVQANAGGYVGFGAERFAGSFAKLLLLAEAQGADPASFGGLNLPAELIALECGPSRAECAATPGRYANETGADGYDAASDFTSPLTQALALIALQRTASADPSAAAVAYLVSEACPDGGYPGSFAASRAGAACTSDVDVTGFVVQALYAVGQQGAAQPALDWLAGRQRADGGFGGTGPTAGANSNSTAIAAQALRVGGRTPAVTRAVRFLRALQAGCSARAADRGRVAYDAAASGDPARATAQAVLALAPTGLAQVSATGIAAAAPTLACTAATPTPTPTTTTSAGRDLTRGGSVLAETGGAATPALATGAALLVAGAGLLLLARRRPESR